MFLKIKMQKKHFLSTGWHIKCLSNLENKFSSYWAFTQFTDVFPYKTLVK